MGIPYNEKTQIMNKFLYVASAVALLCSCSNEIVQEERSDHARTIQFDPYVAGQTRTVAFEATADTLATNGFRVYAWNNETAIGDNLGLYFSDMYQQEAGGSSIVATDDHEWPGATPLNFLGTYPSSIRIITQNQKKAESDEFYDGAIPQTSVHVDTKASAGTKDIMCALAENKSASDGVVNLSFSHILVKVQANISYDEVYIDGSGNGPALMKISLTGTSEADYDVETKKWNVGTDATSNTIEYTLYNTTMSDYWGSTESQPVYEYSTKDTDHIRASLMLIPAKYTLSVEHNQGGPITSEIDLSDKDLEGGDVSSFAGKVVTLNIHISDNHILFAQPTVEPWETGEVIPVD